MANGFAPSLKTIYCLNIATAITFLCFVLWQFLYSSNIEMFKILFNSGLLALLCFRLVKVIRKPNILDAVVTNIALKFLRTLAVFCMSLGVLAIGSLLIAWAVIFISPTPGFVMLPVLAYIGIAGVLGVFGMLLFEAVRIAGRFKIGKSS